MNITIFETSTGKKKKKKLVNVYQWLFLATPTHAEVPQARDGIHTTEVKMLDC